MYTGDKNMINVAIDGPAGAGKSTISRAAADKLGFIYVDTGALYRSVGVYALRNGINTKSGEQLKKALPDIKVELVFKDGVQHVYLNGEDVSEEIRTPKASMAASDVSAVPEVRSFLFDLQRDIAVKNNCIMDGRDIGTVVLPNATVKIYLTADAEVRAKRRYDELIAKGTAVSYESVLTDLKQRDHNDMTREIAPLKQADDAVLADTTELDFEGSCDLLVRIIKEKAEIR